MNLHFDLSLTLVIIIYKKLRDEYLKINLIREEVIILGLSFLE